jgi:hypothetical protein
VATASQKPQNLTQTLPNWLWIQVGDCWDLRKVWTREFSNEISYPIGMVYSIAHGFIKDVRTNYELLISQYAIGNASIAHGFYHG